MLFKYSQYGFKYGAPQLRTRRVSRQRGFVLILALVMLAVLTLIGVSSMDRSNMELKATANARQHQAAFNATQSVLEYTMSEAGVAAIDYQTTTPNSITSYTGAGDLNAKNVSATVNYIGCAAAIGSSLEEGKGFSYSYFNVDGQASNVTGTATSLQSQGVRYPAAGC